MTRRGSGGVYGGYSCIKEHKPFEPTKHQVETKDYFLTSPYKGLLLYHKLGSGKTCTSIMIADTMLRMKIINKVYVLSPGSLRRSWIDEYCKVCGYKSKFLEDGYTFVTYNYGISLKKLFFDDSLVIIDEVHNLINSVKNRARTATGIYEKLMTSRCRILALSGTPIIQYVYEFPILGNLLKPGTFEPNILEGKHVDLESFVTSNFDIKDDGELRMRSRTRFLKQLKGIISYFPGSGTEYYPEVKFMEPIKVTMPHDQEENYWKQNIQEMKMMNPPKEDLKRSDPARYDLLHRLFVMARKRILSRRASNFYYPTNIKDVKDAIAPNGWIDRDALQHQKLMHEYSMKVAALLTNIVLHLGQKQMVFTFFKTKAGVNLIYSILKLCGIKAAIFSGDLDDASRASVLRRFNAEENRYGEKITVLLVNEAGAEGITIKEARHIHILESFPRESKIQQAIGRVVRYMSHYLLPKDEQNVKVWRYWSMATPDPFVITDEVALPDGKTERIHETIVNKETIDEILYSSGQKALTEINSFLKILQSVSVTSYKHGTPQLPVEIDVIPEDIRGKD